MMNRLLIVFTFVLCSITAYSNQLDFRELLLPILEIINIDANSINNDQFEKREKPINFSRPSFVEKYSSKGLGFWFDPRKERVVSLYIGNDELFERNNERIEKTAEALYAYIQTQTLSNFRFAGKEEVDSSISFNWQRFQDEYPFFEDRITIRFCPKGRFLSFDLLDFSETCEVKIIHDSKNKALKQILPSLNNLLGDKYIITRCIENHNYDDEGVNGSLRIVNCNDYFKGGEWENPNPWEASFKFNPRTKLSWLFIVTVSYYDVDSKTLYELWRESSKGKCKQRDIFVGIDAETGMISGGATYSDENKVR